MRIDVRHVADLAKIGLSQDEAAAMEKDLRSILGHMERISEVDLTGVEPTFYLNIAGGVRLSEDSARPGLNRERMLELAPLTRDGYYVVPKEVSAADEKPGVGGPDDQLADSGGGLDSNVGGRR